MNLSSGVIDSKILPFNCSMLFLSLSRITWLICIHSCYNSLPTCCKIFTYENNNAKNSTMFSNKIRNVPIEGDKMMVSFDLTSLYTTITLIDTLNKIKDYV